jgi:uncharacterized protein (DUF2267 family)
MRLSTEDFCSHVCAHAGVPPEHVDRAIRTVLSAIGAYVPDGPRQLVADELSPELGHALQASPNPSSQRIAEQVLSPGMTVGQARELVASVCRVLVEELSHEATRALRAHVPADLGDLLTSVAPEATPQPHSRRERTLADGRPGSGNPISEARTAARQPDSVLDDNPHDDEKLSSAHGTAQEQFDETLANGQVGSSRPVSSTRS